MIYFDAGATTLQKPEAVRRAMYQAVHTLSSPGRGSYPATRRAEETDLRCRMAAAALFHVDDPAHVVFTSCATHGLNIAIRTLVKPGSRVVISGYEHNAVTRPLHAIPNVEIAVADGPLFDPAAMLAQFRQALAQPADAVICTHVSNVFGYVLPVSDIAALCREKGVPFVLDASQSAGMLPVDMEALGASFIAMPGHKGLYGPQGTGLLLCGCEPAPLLRGGTGSQSLLQEMPAELPDRLEAGTHNMPGIAGLLEGLRFVQRQGVARIADYEGELGRYAAQRLADIPGVEVFSGPEQTGVVSFRVSGWDCEELGEALASRGIALRAGLHCAPLAHRTAGTLETGTVRFSPSVFNRRQEVDRLTREVSGIVGQTAKS
ncbi:MAG: aminotransferase class V-fold PLP-dependent enzyme [Clostridiales bacterium]|nr:aminotransferase class V-fold PLP-dependent enzyme [Clostridiales bacterium]